MKPERLAALGVAALLAGVAFFAVRQRAPAVTAELLPYQARVRELPPREQERFAQLQLALREAEQVRAGSKQWPERFAGTIYRRRGVYVNYLEAPADPSRLRWLVLIIEPEPSAIKDPPPPDDEEHHTLADGTALHVSLWSAPNQGAVPDEVLAFPAAEGWTQRLAR